MSDEYKIVRFDFLSNSPKDEQTREAFKRILREKFEARLADMWRGCGNCLCLCSMSRLVPILTFLTVKIIILTMHQS